MELTEKDLVVISRALKAYSGHLAPSSNFVPAIASWQKEVDEASHKIMDILFKSSSR